jgi:uncharacterized protein
MTSERARGKKTGLRVVFDTNVYVSMFYREESPLLELWYHAKKGTYELLTSPAILLEFAEVVRIEFNWDTAKTTHHLKLFSKAGKIIVPRDIPDVIKEDPSDNPILACAIAGEANLIVSKDLDLLRRKRYEGVGIVTPIDFLHMLEGKM